MLCMDTGCAIQSSSVLQINVQIMQEVLVNKLSLPCHNYAWLTFSIALLVSGTSPLKPPIPVVDHASGI